MNDSTYSGRCFCGQVRFELFAAPAFACHCHCESCRHAAGAPFVTWVSFDREAFALTSGTIAEYRSSPGVRRGHCAACGTTITYTVSAGERVQSRSENRTFNPEKDP